ncbi:hypothetical protein HK405_003299 [Cladochytrium tenue]|nr:hypothetical protein HK405_003299 [Cladochytrium tenue]
MATAAVDLAAQLAAADQDFRLAEREKRPLLRHYKGFLRNGGLGPRDLAEAVGYSVPPDELKTVCECLCILKNGAPVPASPPSPPLSPEPSGKSSSLAVLAAGDLHASASEPAADSIPSDSTYDPMTWPKIKLQMCTTDFKAWLSNLRVGVDHLSPLSVKRVERIIMLDPSITYERLRDASTAGYKVLIVVAACLQYGNISEDLRARRRRAVLLERRRSRIVAFITGIEAQARAQEAVGAAAGQAALYDTIESLLEETAFLQGSPSIPPRAQ